ncbi:MAG: outer membrane beta-barrel protein [Xanthobacteraceae bacterium]
MKKLFIATIAVLVSVAAAGWARAADMALKAPIVEPWTWTGFYIGGNGGYSWGNWDSTSVAAIFPGPGGTLVTTDSPNVQGAIAGGQFGYNWQLSPQWLVGVEADGQWSGEEASDGGSTSVTVHVPGIGPCDVGGGCSATTAVTDANSWKLPWFATLRGRVGLIEDSTWLLYGTGGLAVAGADFANSSITTVTVFKNLSGTVVSTTTLVNSALSGTTTMVGFAVGAGIEKMLSKNWSVKVEYLFMDFGSHTFLAGTGFDTNVKMIDNVIRGGVNYKF